MESGRYNRQELIKDWRQEKLEKSRVAVIGAGNLANFTAASLVALGIGNVEIYDNSRVDGDSDREFLLFQARKGEPKVQALEKILREMNPQVRVKGINIKPENNPLISILGKPDVIIELTNSADSKESVLNYANSKGINFVSASADDVRAEMYVLKLGEKEDGARLKDYAGKKQGSLVSETMAGVVTEETRKIIMPLDREQVVKSLAYSTTSSKRFSRDSEFEIKEGDLKDKKVLIIGAGALGNFVALGAALDGIGSMDILDYDKVDSTNLNRQILFYDSVGKKKAEALAEKISKIVPEIKVRGLVEKLDENSNYFEKNKPDLIFDCVDSFAVRAVINYYAVRHGIPLVSGGINPNSGQVVVYEPGESSCLDCKLGVEKALGKARTSSSCRYAPDPSVITIAETIGGMMGIEGRKVLDKRYGEPVRKILKYDSKAPARGGLVGEDGKCDCKKPDAKTWMNEVIEKYGVKNEKFRR